MKNIQCNRKFKIIVLLAILLFAYVFVSAYSYANTISADLAQSVLRLHVIANSDSEEDQNLKYIVRDNLIEYMNSICANVTSKEEAIEVVSNHISEFRDLANKTIRDNGFSYNASVELGNFEFPTKKYADISFPAGFYDALEVKIGTASGQNWWCVLYPALCFIDTSSGKLDDEAKSELQDDLSEEEYQLISDTDSPAINFKFKLIEFFTQNKMLQFTVHSAKSIMNF